MKRSLYLIALGVVLLFFGCATVQPEKTEIEYPKVKAEPKGSEEGKTEPARAQFQFPQPKDSVKRAEPYLPVGIRMQTKYGKAPLEQVLKELLSLKGFKMEAAKDVNMKTLVEVDIQPEDDFFKALKTILSQPDYSFELRDDTIFIFYAITKKYHLPVPYITQDFSSSVGGNLLGGGDTKGMMKGEVQITNKFKEPMDFWKAVEENLRKILGPDQAGSLMVIDRPLGIITITAPNSVHERVAMYLKNMKRELFRQVIIEAKIIEVVLNKANEMGIDWSNLAKTTLSGSIGEGGILYFRRNIIDQVTFSSVNFNLILSALQNYGTTRILSSPRVTLMNGQSATLTVGENIRYIDKVETTTDTQTQTVTYTVSTSSILSGVGVAVLANILDKDEVILYIVPITSELREPIEYRTFGGTQVSSGSQVGLPRVRLKEMSTFARLRQGEALLIGGLIDKNETKNQVGIPILSSIPILGNLFRYDAVQEVNRELVIMIKPTIIDYQED